MKVHHALPLSGITLALLGAHLSAHADDSGNSPTTLAPVVVTATRTPVTADDTLAAVTVISRDQIANSDARDVGDLLRTYADVDVVRLGGFGQPSSIFMRGANSNQTLVLVDGVRINDGTLGGVNIENFRPDDIDHIEIVRGPRSSLYGSDAIGGVINIITARPHDNSTELTVSAGQENTFGGQLKQNFKADSGLAGALNYGGLSSKGYPIYGNGQNYPDFPNLSIDSGNHDQNVGTELDYQSGDFDLRGRFSQNNGTTQYLDGGGNPIDENFLNSLGMINASMQVSPSYLTTLRLSSYRDNIDQNQVSDYAHTHRNEVDWQNDYSLPYNNLLSIGLDYKAEYVSTLSFGSGFGTNLSSKDYFIQDQWKYQQFSVQAAERYENNATFGNHNTGELALGYAFDSHNSVYASLSSGFRAPTGDELYLPAADGGNPNLRPETAHNREIGSHHQFGQWNASTAFYQNDVSNLIASGPAYQLININEARLRGAELGFGYRDPHLSWQNQFAYTQALDAVTQTALLRRPMRTLTSQLDYQWDRYSTGVELVTASHSADATYDLPTFAPAPVTVAGYGVLNLHAGIKLASATKLSFNIDNVANHHYGLAYNTLYNAFYTESSDRLYMAQPRLISATLSTKF